MKPEDLVLLKAKKSCIGTQEPTGIDITAEHFQFTALHRVDLHDARAELVSALILGPARPDTRFAQKNTSPDRTALFGLLHDLVQRPASSSTDVS